MHDAEWAVPLDHAGSLQRVSREFMIAPTPHPCLPTLTDAELKRLVAQPDGAERYAKWFNQREKLIRKSLEDPMNFGFEPEYKFPNGEVVRPWEDADRLLEMECYLLAIFGGNRAMKTFLATKRLCQCIRLFGGGTYVAMAEKEESSRARIQKDIWHWLEPHYGHLNGKHDPRKIYKINYTPSGGFTENKAVFPNRSELYLLNYKQAASEYEGWEFGAPKDVYERVSRELRAAGQFCPVNLAVVADESMPLSWLEMYSRRLKFRKAKLMWPFTPIKGITPAIKEFVGKTARTIRALPSELLPRQNLPELQAGQMPYIQETFMPASRAIYFFSIFNPFGGYYQEIKSLCEGKTEEYTERVAYGYARDSVARALPKFGAVNVIKRKQLPAEGTNYMFTDPAGVRNWATIWIRVGTGNPSNYYIYRDWPDEQRYGAWAVPTERETSEDTKKGWDGDPGPAQNPSVAGILPYKRMFLSEEKIAVPAGLMELHETDAPAGRPYLEEILARVEDPYHRALIRERLENGTDLTELRERIRERQIDPRAGRNETQAEKGGTCLIDEMAKPNLDRTGKVVCDPMIFRPASGVSIDEGISLINELLDWNENELFMPLLNAPRLYVTENCRQVIWAMENYTGRAGETGACKDFIDLLRYMALARLRHIAPGMVKTMGGGSY